MLSCELFPLALLPLKHLPAAQISCVPGLQEDWDFTARDLFEDQQMKSFLPVLSSVWGHGAELSYMHVPHVTHPSRTSYLFDEGCCLQAAFAISNLILELLPQLLEVVWLPQNVVLAHGVLLAELPALPHHFCTYGPVWIALCLESLAPGQRTRQHSSFPTSQEKRVAPTLCCFHASISKSPMSDIFTTSLFTLISLGWEKKVRNTESSNPFFLPSKISKYGAQCLHKKAHFYSSMKHIPSIPFYFPS